MGNNALTNLTGLDGLASIGGSFMLGNNDALISLTGLEHLTFVGGSEIWGNNVLPNLTGPG